MERKGNHFSLSCRSSPPNLLIYVSIAFLSFGIAEPASLCLLTGLLVAAFGALELGIYLKYPELFEEGS
jgi:hypothetical protein